MSRLKQFLKHSRKKLIKLTRKEARFFYNEDFAKAPTQNKNFCGEVYRIIAKEFNPSSVIDFGCGTGDILKPFEEKGIEVLGVDFSKANRRHSKINLNNFQIFDLRKKYIGKKKYALCLCLEVAEHIEEKYSDVLIRSITSTSDTVMFTSALPGVDGTDHCNLKPTEWWAIKFNKLNFKEDTETTKRTRSELLKILPEENLYYANSFKIYRKLKNT